MPRWRSASDTGNDETFMTLTLDMPVCAASFVQRLDPRWKLAGVLLAALACALLRSVGPALAALAGSLLLVALARLPLAWYLRRLASALVMFTLLLIWLPFVVQKGDATLDLGSFTLSVTGLLRWLALSARLTAMVSLMLVLLATTPIADTFKAARSIGLPRLFVMLMLLTYRYVFLLMGEFARLRTALRARGFRNRADLHSYRTIGQVAGTLLVRSHERSERVAQAMRARGFDGEFRSLETFQTRPGDVLAFVILVTGAFAVLGWDYWSLAA